MSFVMSSRTCFTKPLKALQKSKTIKCAKQARPITKATGTMVDENTGIKKMRDGIKEAADENLLTPRFYTTGTHELYYVRAWCDIVRSFFFFLERVPVLGRIYLSIFFSLLLGDIFSSVVVLCVRDFSTSALSPLNHGISIITFNNTCLTNHSLLLC